MKRNHLVMAVLAAWGVLALAGCGGGGGSTQTGQTTSGVVTGFGSVYINGVEYTVNGSVIADGASSSEANLQVGMVVTGDCSLDAGGTTGTCSSLSYADVVEGYVLTENITNGVGTLNVMGMTVSVDANTLFESHDPSVTSIDAIPANAIAEVSGYTAGDGTVYATRVEIKDPAASHDLELKGVVSGLDAMAKTFTIGSLVIDFNGASSVPGNLADGLYVEVKFSAAPSGTGTLGDPYTLTASKVEMEDDGDIGVDGSEGEDLEQEGVVTAVDTSASTITINGQVMSVGQNANLHNLTFDSTLVGTYVEAEAEFLGGEWVVKEIQPEDGHSSDVELKADIESLDASAGTITLLGKTITLNSNTLMHDATGANHHFGMSNMGGSGGVLQVGDRVEVNVSIDASGNWIATKLSRESTSTGVVLEGSLDLAAMTLAGITVDLSAITGINLSDGMSLEVTGTWDATSSTLTASTAVIR